MRMYAVWPGCYTEVALTVALLSTMSLIAKQKLDSVAIAEEPVTANFDDAFPTLVDYQV